MQPHQALRPSSVGLVRPPHAPFCGARVSVVQLKNNLPCEAVFNFQGRRPGRQQTEHRRSYATRASNLDAVDILEEYFENASKTKKVTQSKLKSLSVPQLIGLLGELNIEPAGRKPELVRLLFEQYNVALEARGLNMESRGKPSKRDLAGRATTEIRKAALNAVLDTPGYSSNAQYEDIPEPPSPIRGYQIDDTPESEPSHRILNSIVEPGPGPSTIEDSDRSWFNLGNCDTLTDQAAMQRQIRDKNASNETLLSVTWLGTSSGAPSIGRNISSIALRTGNPEKISLVDCGEGTTYQFSTFGLDVTAVTGIFITHHHGDHCFGLPALVQARNAEFARRGVNPDPLLIHGPVGTADLVTASLSTTVLAPTSPKPALMLVTEWVFNLEDSFNPTPVPSTRGIISVCRKPPDQANPKYTGSKDTKVIGQARSPGSDYRDKKTVPVVAGLTWTVMGAGGMRVQTAQLTHRVPCWGYVFQEPITLSNGKKGGRKAVLLGDTCDSTAIARIAQGADLLSHEATFLASMAPKAKKATHSTSQMAGEFASRVNAKQLVLTHFSGRYGEGGMQPLADGEQDLDREKEFSRDLKMLQSEARRAAGTVPVACAYDGFTWRL